MGWSQCPWGSPRVKSQLLSLVVLLLTLNSTIVVGNRQCPEDKTHINCSKSGDILLIHTETFIPVNDSVCTSKRISTQRSASCVPSIEVRGKDPCKNGRQLVHFQRWKLVNCVCSPVRYTKELPCPCQRSHISNETCSGHQLSNRIQTITYERRVGDRCETHRVRVPVRTCATKTLNSVLPNTTDHEYLRRSARSVEAATTQCGENQVFSFSPNPCAETCEQILFGKPSVCKSTPQQPGCECRVGYVLDGVLCVPPSQCGCLNSLCIDRAPLDLCRKWKAEGRCTSDRDGMNKVCRATCQGCHQPCQDQIATVQCERLKQQGKCREEFYRLICRLTCSPQDCSCPPCRQEIGTCNPHTKNLEVTHTCFRLQRDGRCTPVVTRSFKPCGACPRGGRVRRGRCNRLTGFALDQLEFWSPVLTKCKCRLLTKFIRRICSCGHLDHIPTRAICVPHKGIWLKKHVVYRLRNGNCHAEQHLLKKAIVCVRNFKSTLHCDPTTCESVRVSTWFEQVGCRCVKKMNRAHGKCCCPPGRIEKECGDDDSVLTTKKITFLLDPNKQECVPQIDRSVQEIQCNERNTRVLKQYCDRQSCHPATVYHRVVRKRCGCVNLIRRVLNKRLRCCCPPPRFMVRCYPQYGVVSKIVYRYELFKGHCASRKFVDQDKHVCPKGKVFRSPCDRSTGLRLVVRHTQVSVGCQCRAKVRRTMEPCECPLPHIVKKRCAPGASVRQVFRLRFELRMNEASGRTVCYRRMTRLPDEPCNCQPPVVLKQHCVRGELVLVRKDYRMSDGENQPRCMQKVFIKRIPVLCNDEGSQTVRSKCHHWRRRVVQIRELLDPTQCRCQKVVKAHFEGCDCSLRNRVYKECRNGVQMIVKEIYTTSPNVNHCVKSVSRGIHPVVCTGKPEVFSTSGCTIQRPNGIFQSEEVRWQQVVDCRCVTHRKQMLRLCACPEPVVARRCLDTTNLVLYKTTFTRIADQCLPNRDVVTTEIRCSEPPQIVDKTSCETVPTPLGSNGSPHCLETFRIAVRQVHECQCLTKHVVVRRRCCVPEPKIERHCDPAHSTWVTVYTNYTLASGKVLFESDNLVIRDRVAKPMREQQEQQVVCPTAKVNERCDSQTGLLTRTVVRFNSVKCACQPTRVIERGKCQRKLIHKGSCRPKPTTYGEDQFRKTVWAVFRREGCKCIILRVIEDEMCSCQPDNRIERRCVDDHLREILHTQRRSSSDGKNCIRTVISRVIKPVGKSDSVTELIKMPCTLKSMLYIRNDYPNTLYDANIA
ncbi:unnamed protein product [Dicrocoelium dendriticum]|nr:unnamed protein product [Dicrocoelium dendriticum]CAH8436919.1 unnamed protein product [Dicrocoelium dendriticum]